MTDKIESRIELNDAQLRRLLNNETDAIRVPDMGTQGETTPISEVVMDRSYNLVGTVCNIEDTHEFNRSDGEGGQVRNIRLQDRTGSLRLSLWGDLADKRFEIGDTLHVTQVEIEDGFQDTFEGSVGYDSMVSVIDSPDDPIHFVTVALEDADLASGAIDADE